MAMHKLRLEFTVPTSLNYTFVLFLCMVLSSYGFVLNNNAPQQAQQKPPMANMQPANFKTAATMPQSQIITFPDMVTPQTMAEVDTLPGDQHFKLKLVVAKKQPSQKNTELDALEADDGSALRQAQGTAPLTNQDDNGDVEDGDDEDDPFPVQAQKPNPKYTKKDRVFIPENGTFKVTFQAGSDYRILDGDARDGSATVQMPREVLAAYVKVRGKFSRDAYKQFPAMTRQLNFSDPLYYIKQDISRQKKNQGKQAWLSLGNRALPIPADWRSADGDKYVLKFNNQGATRVVMRWYQTKGTAVGAYPLGIKEIGSAGGVIELPGVGTLKVPAGALSQNTVITMRQLKQVIDYDDHVDVAPPVALEPEGLTFSIPALIRLNIDKVKVGRNHPAQLFYIAKLKNAPDDQVDVLNGVGSFENATWDDWFEMNHFTDVRALMPRSSIEHPLDKMNLSEPLEESSRSNVLDCNGSADCTTAPHEAGYNQTQTMRQHQSKGQAQADYPPGVKLIGPAGGVVELPGVAKLEIPAGAIATPTVITVKQRLTGEYHEYSTEVGPLIALEPDGLNFAKPALIRLEINKTLVGRNHPGLLAYSLRSKNIVDRNVYSLSLTRNASYKNMSFDDYFLLPYLGEVAAFMARDEITHPLDQMTPSEELEESFSIQ